MYSLLVNQCDAAINALDFTSDIPFVFDEICQSKNVPVLHPYNIGWAGLIFVVMPEGENFSFLSKDFNQFEKTVVNHVLESIDVQHNSTKDWLARFYPNTKKRVVNFLLLNYPSAVIFLPGDVHNCFISWH